MRQLLPDLIARFNHYLAEATHSKKACSLYIDDKGLGLAVASLAGASPSLLMNGFYECQATSSSRADLLNSLVNEHQLKDVPCSLVLHPRYYKLMLVDKPPVNNKDLDDALKWQIKDKLGFPITDAIVAGFETPALTYAGNRKRQLAYAVVSRHSRLEPLVKQVEMTGLGIENITTLDLALRDFILQRHVSEGALSILYQVPSNAGMLILENQRIQLIRHFPIINDDDPTIWGNTIIDEVMRSYHYYRSQLGQEAPKSMAMLVDPAVASMLADLCEARLDKKAMIILQHGDGGPMDMEAIIDWRCGAVIGACMHKEDKKKNDGPTS